MKTAIVAVVCVLFGLGLGVATGYWQYTAHQAPGAGVASAAAGSSDGSVDRPVAVIDQTVYDFSVMEQGKTMKHSFVIFNRGTQPLKLEKGDTTCKCTLSELENNLIQPGQSGTVTLEWHAESGPGPFRQTATIHTNDPLRPEINLEVNGEITEGVSVLPVELVFTSLPSNEPTSAKATVTAFAAENLEIVSAKFEDPAGEKQFEISTEPAPADVLARTNAKSGVVLTVTSKPGLPLGPIRHKILLETNFEGTKLELPIQGSVTSDISILGQNWRSAGGGLRMGLVKSRDGASEMIKLVTRGPHRETIEFELQSKTPDYLQVEIGERSMLGEKVSQVPLTISIPKDTPPDNHSGTQLGKFAEVHLKTNHPDVPEVRIRVQFVIED